VHSTQTQPTDAAVRSDPITSTIEIAGFLDSGSEDRLFGAVTLPSGEPKASVLISSSLYAESARNYRREIILARDLAVRGIASLRFHYRGTGYSDGDPAALAFPTMCADATAALAQLTARCPGLPTGYVGTRLGALVAARLARAAASAPVVLWDPISSPAIFFQDATKARRAGGMIAGKQHGASPAEEDPWGTGFLDSLGYRLPLGLRNSLEGLSLAECLGAASRPILIASVVPGYEPKSQAEAAAEILRRTTGSEVDLRRIEGRLSWWTSRDSWDPDEDHPATREVIARSAEWLERRLTEEPAS
jgi:alpha/beta superfamily hydrolase